MQNLSELILVKLLAKSAKWSCHKTGESMFQPVQRTAITIFFLLISSCQSFSLTKSTSTLDPRETAKALPQLTLLSDIKLSSLPCDKLIEKSQDSQFSLKGLAGLKAQKNCPPFKYDQKQLSDLEKKIFSEEISDLDPSKPPQASSLSVVELKENLKKAKTAPDIFKAYKQLRAKQKNLGLRNDFLKTSAELFNWAKSDWKKNKKGVDEIGRFYEATLIFARTYWTEEKKIQADKILIDSLRLLKGVTSVAEIYFIQGRMADEEADHEHAVALYDATLEDIRQYNPKGLSFSYERVLWLKSWTLYKTKKWSEAEKSFLDYAKATSDSSEKAKAAFFQARCLSQMGKKDESQKILEKITQDEFFGYYGLVAYYELGKKFPAIAQIKYDKKFNFDLDLSFLSPNEKNIFIDLIRYQEVDLAEKSIIAFTRNPEKQVNLGLYLASTGKRYLPLFAAFFKLSNESKIEVLMRYPDLIFPQPYPEKVKEMSEKTQIPTSLIYSIMKQESAFNEKTRSHADAMGLMQMIPRLAKQLSKKFDVAYSNPDDLFNPLINIQLGSYELMEQVKKQSGQLTFVAAAYNAGPNALANWLKTRKRPDMIEFIEEIPYDETRTYVKVITRNKLFYERLSKRDEEFPFPTEFLNLPLN